MRKIQLLVVLLLTSLQSISMAGNLTVDLAPSQAVSAGARWRVDGGSWKTSGSTVKNLSNTTHAVDFKTIAGWGTPQPISVTLTNGVTTRVTGTYASPGSIRVTLAPTNATWRVDGGTVRNSGTTATPLAPGAHTVSYNALANHLAPPSETVTVTSGQTTALTRSYTPAGQLFVRLQPTTAQWRVDGGAWRATDTYSGLLPAGTHTIEYSPLANYRTPAAETVTVTAAQTLTIIKTYAAETGAHLHVKTVPAYLAENGLALWRVDGGVWHSAGTSIPIAPGTRLLEFQPIAGAEVPPASSITVQPGAVHTLEATFLLTHRLRFFLHTDLVAGMSMDELQRRLSQYTAHLQTIWHRESIRRLTFNPATDVSVVNASPFSNNAYPPLPELGYEMWVYADWANGSIYGSNGGYKGLDVSGAGGATGMHWTEIYDPAALTAGSTEMREYWKHIDTVTHEFEHVFGAGMGEYYSAAQFRDLTGIAPLYDVSFFTPEDPFWNARSDYWGDPLLRTAYENYRIGNPTSLPALLDAVRFSANSRAIVNGCYRTADSPFNNRTTLPDLSPIRIRVVDANSGQPIAGATLRIWNRPNPSATGGQEIAVVPTGTAGIFEFTWVDPVSSQPPLNSYENGKLLKAWANGYQPKAQWEWIYDAQRAKTVDGSDEYEITVALDPAP